ncbi:MAG: serine/threonine protein kinase, partial [Cyanobacteria bacterium]|nr:serine/threonine protein kinase [Cyanobacteriota bacterium]
MVIINHEIMVKQTSLPIDEFMNDSNPSANREMKHPLVGTTIGRYDIVDAIGMGAVCTVLKARVVENGETVAVKLLPHDIDSTSAKRLETEARILRDLDHPNIVKTFDFCISPAGYQMLIIEYVNGKNLKEVIEKHVVLPVIRALGIFIQIADGMQFAHSKAILHRDLKPHNVMLASEPSDRVKILDFGIAKLTAENQNLTRTGEVLGSPIYMSPEQGRGLKLDERSDIYSFGVLMYQVLTGAVPHRGASAAETMALKCGQPPPRFKDVAPGLVFPDSLESLVLRCLEPNLDNRITTMRAVKTHLEEILLGLKDSSKPRSMDEAGKSYAAIPSTNRQTIDSFISPKVREAAEHNIDKDDFRKSRRDSEAHRKKIVVRNAVILLVLLIVSAGGIVAGVNFLTKHHATIAAVRKDAT